MSLSNRTFSLLLAMTPGVGGRTLTKVLTRNTVLGRDASDFMKLSPEALREEYQLKKVSADSLTKDPAGAIEFATHLERRLNILGVTLVTTADANYPRRIEELDTDPPGVLFLYGNTKLLEAPTFAVLGSRHTPPANLTLIETLTEEGVLNGEVLVTGHDTKEYQRSAVVPLRWGAPRILCLDRGLFKVLGPELKDEAFRAARLWRYEFDPRTDLVVSPFRPEADFIGVNNKIRDQLVVTLSMRTAFVHINEGGNMDKLAKLALKGGRQVSVSDTILGYRTYKREGATVIEERQ